MVLRSSGMKQRSFMATCLLLSNGLKFKRENNSKVRLNFNGSVYKPRLGIMEFRCHLELRRVRWTKSVLHSRNMSGLLRPQVHNTFGCMRLKLCWIVAQTC